MKNVFAILATLFCALMICACASNEPKPDYDKVRSEANEAYQEAE